MLIGSTDPWTVAAGGPRRCDFIDWKLVLVQWSEHSERQRLLQPHTVAAHPQQQPPKPGAAEPLRQGGVLLLASAFSVTAAKAQGHVGVRLDDEGQVGWRKELDDGGQAGPAIGGRGLRHPRVIRVQTPAAVSLDKIHPWRLVQ